MGGWVLQIEIVASAAFICIQRSMPAMNLEEEMLYEPRYVY